MRRRERSHGWKLDDGGLDAVKGMVLDDGLEGVYLDRAYRCARAVAALLADPDAPIAVLYLCSADCGRFVAYTVKTDSGPVWVPTRPEAGSVEKIDPTSADPLIEPDMPEIDGTDDIAGWMACRHHPQRVMAIRSLLLNDYERAVSGPHIPVRIGLFVGTPPVSVHLSRDPANARNISTDDAGRINTTAVVAERHVVL